MTDKNIVVAIDAETTGVEPGSRLVELAAVMFNNSEVLGTFQELINPGMPLPPDASKVNGITSDMIADKPGAGEVLDRFFEWMPAGAMIIARYAQYDTGVISWEAARAGLVVPQLPVLCTCNMCRQAYLLMLDLSPIRFSPVPWDQAGHDYKYPENLPCHLADLPRCIDKGEPFRFCYTDAKGATTERTITPYGYAEKDGTIMFHGLCHMRGERRTFRADRVVNIPNEVADEDFQV